MSEDGKMDERLADEACRLLSREELIVGHKEDGRAQLAQLGSDTNY